MAVICAKRMVAPAGVPDTESVTGDRAGAGQTYAQLAIGINAAKIPAAHVNVLLVASKVTVCAWADEHPKQKAARNIRARAALLSFVHALADGSE